MMIIEWVFLMLLFLGNRIKLSVRSEVLGLLFFVDNNRYRQWAKDAFLAIIDVAFYSSAYSICESNKKLSFRMRTIIDAVEWPTIDLADLRHIAKSIENGEDFDLVRLSEIFISCREILSERKEAYLFLRQFFRLCEWRDTAQARGEIKVVIAKIYRSLLSEAAKRRVAKSQLRNRN